MEYKDLNEMQTKALFKTQGPLLILAGAGSGKTKVVTNKIAYLITEKAMNPSSILAITFTNKAAKEMRDRVNNLINIDSENMWIGTFHAICVRILRKNIKKLDYTSNFSIYDSDDQKTLLRDCLNELNLNKEIYKPKSIIARISELKNQFVKSDEYIKINYNDFYNRNIGEIYQLYQKKLKENNALDFDDIILNTVELLEKNDDIRMYYQNKFVYVFVDEYQDTNMAQYKLVKLICKENPNLTVVGDNDQSIYKWRGADISNILNFEKDFPGAEVILLEQNYRSTSKILNVANEVIKNNGNRKDKNLWTNKNSGNNVIYENYRHSQEEERSVATKILQLNYKGQEFSDIAILYRTNIQARGFEEALIRESIPYKIIGGLKFYDRREVKDIIAYLKLIQNSDDIIALKRIINVPKRGIGKQTIDTLIGYAEEKNIALFDLINQIDEIEDIKLRAKSKIKEFSELINIFNYSKIKLKISELIEKVIDESGYIKELEIENTPESRTRIENIKELVSTALDFERENPNEGLEEFLAGISLMSDADKNEDSDRGVKLMTIHSSKGLEFRTVFLVGMEENLFPTSRALDNDEDIEEERRLCYVALTRAKENLYISSAQTRTIYGTTSTCKESRFIDEMGDTIIKNISKEDKLINKSKLIEVKDFISYNSNKNLEKKSLSEDKNVKVGDKVNHKKWGQGMVVSKKEKNNDFEIVVSFEGRGLKKLMLSFAPIKRCD